MTHAIEQWQTRPQTTNSPSATRLPESGEGLFTQLQRLDYLLHFGCHSQHFTGLQPGMRYFDVPGKGYLAFRVQWGQAVVLGDPVSSAQDFEEILAAFLRRHAGASFVQVGAGIAKILNRRWRYYGTQLGTEQRVPLENWSISGKSRKCLRKAVNRARARDIHVEESSRRDNVDDVSDDWLKTRPAGGRELEFLVRPLDMPHARGTRYFQALQDGNLIGFADFDPGYLNGEVVSYMPNISRGCADFSQGIFYTIMAHAMIVFRSEGVRWLELGLSPMVIDGTAEAFESQMLRSVFQLVYRYGRHYNFRGLHFTKSRFGGDWSPTYCCHRSALPVVDLARLTALTGLLRRKSQP